MTESTKQPGIKPHLTYQRGVWRCQGSRSHRYGVYGSYCTYGVGSTPRLAYARAFHYLVRKNATFDLTVAGSEMLDHMRHHLSGFAK
jgi:hypothetical protein